MRTTVIILGVMLMLTGAVWSLQGADLLGGSFMTGDRHWLMIGLGCLFAGLALLVGAGRMGARA